MQAFLHLVHLLIIAGYNELRGIYCAMWDFVLQHWCDVVHKLP